MSVQMVPQRDGRVIYQTYVDPVDMREIATEFVKMQRQYLDPATKPVHALINMLGMTHPPANILSGALQLVRKPHPMGGEIILVTSNMFVLSMSNIFKRLVKHSKVSVFTSLDEAWKYADTLLDHEKPAQQGV